MIYMVEMALLDTGRRAEWDAWYVAHQHRLLSIAGFRASQRFEAIHVAHAPFVALHEVDSPEIFTSPPYRANAGPSNTGEWQARMGNWHRNLFAGADHTPDVPTDARLVVVEEDGSLNSQVAGRAGSGSRRRVRTEKMRHEARDRGGRGRAAARRLDAGAGRVVSCDWGLHGRDEDIRP